MNREEVLSGKAGLSGIQSLLNGSSSRLLLRQDLQRMLKPGYHAGPFHLTRLKFKPGRKLSAYFTLPVFEVAHNLSNPVHLAATWQKDLDGKDHAGDWNQLQKEADRAGLMPVQCELWRDIPERGTRLQIWPFDPEFPNLVRLGDPTDVSGMLTSLGIAEDLKQMPVVTPIRYRPGERHVLRYEIEPSGATAGRRLYAKLYSSAEDAARAFGIANRVVDWLNGNDQDLQGIRPEALSPADAVILYPHAPGVPLSHQLHRSPRWLARQLQIIGRALATLHNGPETLQADLKQNTFAKESKVVLRASEHIQVLLPETYAKILQTVEQAGEGYSRLPQEQPTFTHSDFKSDHILTTPQGLMLIDFDTCTLTDPALDLGKFLADLEWWFTLKGISGVEEAQAQLLKGYSGERGGNQELQDRLRRAKLFHALIFTKIVVRRVPLYKKDWAEVTARMIERAAQVIAVL